MNDVVGVQIEEQFLSLPREKREAIITHGAAFLLADLRNRLFLAESKIRFFEEKYLASLSQLDADGLPDGAGWEIHEDYILWHHWAQVAEEARHDIACLEGITQRGLHLMELPHVGQ